MKKYEESAIRGILFFCLVEIYQLKYPEISFLYAFFLGALGFGIIYGMMYMWDKFRKGR